jgi:GT2 family glycosyltransferase
VPEDKDWIKKLVDIISSDERIAAVGSNVVLPKEVWDTYGFLEKIVTAGNVNRVGMGISNKGDVYRKSSLEEVGYFSSGDFRVAGEDVDLLHKLALRGYFVLSGHNAHAPTILHLHGHHQLGIIKALKKYLQFGETAGVLARKWKRKVLKAYSRDYIKLMSLGLFIPKINIPILILLFLVSIKSAFLSFKRTKFIPVIFIQPFFSLIGYVLWSIGFLVGVVRGKQKF